MSLQGCHNCSQSSHKSTSCGLVIYIFTTRCRQKARNYTPNIEDKTFILIVLFLSLFQVVFLCSSSASLCPLLRLLRPLLLLLLPQTPVPNWSVPSRRPVLCSTSRTLPPTASCWSHRALCPLWLLSSPPNTPRR